MKADFWYIILVHGAVVHLGERLTGSQKVGGSNPPGSTFFSFNITAYSATFQILNY